MTLSPATRFVRSLDGEYFMVSEAAKMLEVSERTLRRLINETRDVPEAEKLGPSFYVNFGKIPIYLYTRADIEKIRVHLSTKPPVLPLPVGGVPSGVIGRPRRWTSAQRKERNRLYSRINYYRARAQDHRLAGDVGAARDAEAQVAQAQAELKAMKEISGG